MQTFQSGYRGLNLLVQLGADRVLVPLLIALCLMAAAHIGFDIAAHKLPVTPEIF